MNIGMAIAGAIKKRYTTSSRRPWGTKNSPSRREKEHQIEKGIISKSIARTTSRFLLRERFRILSIII
jgi:hypothetical protein